MAYAKALRVSAVLHVLGCLSKTWKGAAGQGGTQRNTFEVFQGAASHLSGLTKRREDRKMGY